MFDVSLYGAVVAGLLSFLSPCILPMVPFYLSYMAGISMSELRGDGGIAPGAQKRIFVSAVFFAFGVTTIFVLLGLGATALGQAFRSYREPLSYVSAGVLLVFGLHFLGILRIPFLYREARLESTAKPSSILGAYLMGLAFGFGWTPCVGPALAAILMMASMQDSLGQGALLLMTYGLSMTLPFVIAALFAQPFLKWMARNRRYFGHVEKVMGAMLVLFAILIATNSVNYIAQFMIDMFPGFTNLG